MSPHLQRAIMLLEHRRYQEAEEELRRSLVQEPEDAFALSLLAQCLAERKKHDEAVQVARKAAGLAPEEPMSFHALAYVQAVADRPKEALEAIDEAIRLDPEDEDHYALKASILIDEKRWTDALHAAKLGLAIDPENVACQNFRAMALRSLGRFDEADATLETTLSRDPDSAFSHANKGWTLLHQNNHKQAMVHFREALRLNPEMEYARRGILEALKARNIIYRQMLKYFLFMSRMTPGVQWGIVIGLYVLMRVLNSLGKQYPQIRPYVIPILIAYAVFVFLSWTAQPLFNLMLRIHPFGKLALNDEEKMASNLTGLSLLAGIACLVAGAIMPSTKLLISGAVLCAMVIPISGAFLSEPGRGRAMLFGLTAILCAVGLTGAALMYPVLLGFFIIGIFLFTWIANAVISAG